ncbi:hypothetical protein [Empedobacter brevis]|uniref:hypothetical protein n=1 Tax=Empedobacter brevis TaxID=247 RepID=UPI0028AFEF19|nr:hypothetical protein [Empedobacter brevis]
MYTFSEYFSEFVKSYKPKTESQYFLKILESIQINFDYNYFNKIVDQNGIGNLNDIKFESLDLLISYADFILEDNVISDTEIQDFTFLKRIFKIKEGDFKKYKNLEMNEILKKEFIRIYSDNFVNEKEALLNLNLQSLFNLSYDEFEEIKKDEIIKSLIQGANPKDLDITKLPKGFTII